MRTLPNSAATVEEAIRMVSQGIQAYVQIRGTDIRIARRAGLFMVRNGYDNNYFRRAENVIAYVRKVKV